MGDEVKWIVIERRYRWGGLPLFFAVEVSRETPHRWYYVPPERDGCGDRKEERYIAKGDNRVSPPFPSSATALERIAALDEVYHGEIEKLDAEINAMRLAMSSLLQARRKDLKAPYEG